MSRKTRKLIWSAPLVAVLAIAGALSMFAAQGTGNVFANPLPDAPEITSVEAADGDAGRTTLVVTWTAADNASGYRIDKLDGSGAVWETFVTADDPHTGTTYMDDTLTADDTRWYRVFALNGHGTGPVSNAASGTTDMKVRPGSVMNLRAVPNAKNPRSAIDLSWDPPADNGGEHIVGYEVQFHDDSDWGNLADADADPAVTVIVDNVTAVMVDDPKAPVKMEITDGDDLAPGDSRLYRVRAINGPATFPDGDSVSATTAENTASKDWARITGTTTSASAPGQVTGLTAVNIADDEISLYWYAPEDTGGWDISGYLIQARREGKRFQAIPKDDDLTTTPSTDITLGDVGDDHLDNMNRVIAVPGAGTTQVIFASIVTVDHDGDTGEADATAAIQVKWYFRVFALTTDDGPNDATDTTDDVIRRSQSPSNVASDTAAQRNIDHDDNADTAALDPLAPPTLEATTGPDAKEKQIDLSVTRATALTNADPEVEQIAYRVDYSKDAGVTWKLLEDDTRFTGFGESRPYEDDDGLGFDESRSYRIFAIGRHPYTDVGPAQASVVTGSTEASTRPDAPTGVMASSPSLTKIDASWTAPEDNGGQPIVKYYYQYAPDDDDGVAEDADITSGTTVNVHSSAMTMGMLDAMLTGDTVYAFRVAAVNKVSGTGADRPATTATDGDIAWSKPVLFNTSEAAKPTAVEGLTSEAATDASGSVTGVNLLWNKPSNKIMISNYDIEVMDEHGDWINPEDGENWTANNTSYTDPDEPAADEVRKYRVRADNDVDPGPWTMVYYPREPDTHTHVAASGTIPAQTVTVDTTETVNAAMYFSANTGATYAAMSDMTDVATVMTDANTGMVTITGVAEGTATITVTATSGAVEAKQEFMVTVEAADTTPTAPSGVMAEVVTDDRPEGTVYNVKVTWTDGANAEAHGVLLFTSDFSLTDHIARGLGGSHTFENVAAGSYIAVVVVLDAQGGLVTDANGDYLYAGAESTVMVQP